MITLEIPGNPVAWRAHAGFGRRSFNPRYEEKKHHQWFIKEHFSGPMVSEACSCSYTFEMPIPSATSKVRRTKMLNGEILPTKRPDCTNLQKFCEDCLIGIVLEDDSLVVEVNSRKIFSAVPKTIIRIELIKTRFSSTLGGPI